MGASNWSWQSHGGLSTDVVHVDDLLESFSEYRAAAEREFARYMEANYTNRVPEGEEITLDWGKKNGLEDLIETAVGDDYPLWDDQEVYFSDESTRRYDDLVDGVIQTLEGAKLPGVVAADGPLRSAEFESGALVLAKGPYTQLVARNWESLICLGVGPSDKLEQFGELPVNKAVEAFLVKCWSACDPRDTAFASEGNWRAAPIALTARESAQIKDMRRFSGAGLGVSADVLGSVVARVIQMARDLQDGDGDTVLRFNQDGNVDAAESAFKEQFGISPEDLIHAQDDVEVIVEFMGEFSATPAMVTRLYQQEFSAVQGALLNALAAMDEKPYRADTAWTSKAVDLSPYRLAAVVQLDASGVNAFLYGDNPSAAIASAKPGCVSKMSESIFDRTVLGAVTEMYPTERKKTEDGMFALYTPGAGAHGAQEGVLVFRGHESWGNFDKNKRLDAQWMKEGATAKLGDLPAWMHLATNGSEVREILNGSGASASIAKGFYDAKGDLDVTGVLVEVRDGDYGNIFVTYASRPENSASSYEVVKLNDQWNEPQQPEPTQGVTHG